MERRFVTARRTTSSSGSGGSALALWCVANASPQRRRPRKPRSIFADDSLRPEHGAMVCNRSSDDWLQLVPADGLWRCGGTLSLHHNERGLTKPRSMPPVALRDPGWNFPRLGRGVPCGFLGLGRRGRIRRLPRRSCSCRGPCRAPLPPPISRCGGRRPY